MVEAWRDELTEWLAPFLGMLGDRRRARMCPAYVEGLIGPGDRKSVQPMAAREMRQTLFSVRTDLASTLIREGEFTNPAPGLTVYAQSVDATGLIHNLFIHQEKDGGGATTYTAEEGRLEKRNGKPVLAMVGRLRMSATSVL